MKIIYFYSFSGNADSGVNKKMLDQVHSLNEAGVPSTLYTVIEGHTPVPADPCITTVRYTDPHPSKIYLLKIISRERIVNILLSKLIATLSNDDIIYMRIPYPSVFSWLTLRKSRKCKIVIEYQTIEPVEYRIKGMLWYLVVDLLFGSVLRKKTDAVVGVTEEITRYQIKRGGDPGKPHITVGNGFNVHSVPQHLPPQYNATEIHLICVAEFSVWHGLDRLIWGVKKYQGSVKIIIHIVGNGKDIPRLKKMVHDLELVDNVTFHGFQKGTDLDDLYNISHIAVGSLGIHRLGLKEASTLKAREFCARGIPYIIACADMDFPDDFSYIHRVPPDDTPLEIENIIEFVQTVCSDPNHPQKMRTYALKCLDWSVKMRTLKKFLEFLIIQKEKNINYE